ncbi:MAG: sialidase family protein [Candidatus Brocadiia bacterium]
METTTVFERGENNVAIMRIPGAVVAPDGTVLAFCEARDAGDRSPTDMVMKRSTDGGRTWGPLQLVAKAPGKDAMMNPCPVSDRETGAVFLVFNQFPEGSYEEHAQPGAVRTLVSRSDDGGLTWDGPRDITDDVIDTNKEYGKATGPGCGIQDRQGRLLIPLGIGQDEQFGTLIVSDDHGETWTSTARTPATSTELQVVELADGSLRLDMRNQQPEQEPKHCRCYSISSDGGQSWTEVERDDGLVDVRCQGSIARLSRKNRGDERNRLLFANPDSSYQNRVNMTVKMSYDEGDSWPVAKTIYPGPTAYCCLAPLPDGSIGLLYENGDEGPYERISFARFDLEWLTDGSDD